jgi:hypothetical protein
MSILSDKNIAELCKQDPPLIENYLDWEWQLQPAALDYNYPQKLDHELSKN